MPRSCSGCDKVEGQGGCTLKKCSGCVQGRSPDPKRYCSQSCQLGDWRTGGHKQACPGRAEGTAQVAAASAAAGSSGAAQAAAPSAPGAVAAATVVGPLPPQPWMDRFRSTEDGGRHCGTMELVTWSRVEDGETFGWGGGTCSR